MTIANDFAASGLVVMRTPLLPRETLDAWTHDLRAASADDATLDDALTHDRALLRERLQAFLFGRDARDARRSSPRFERDPGWMAGLDIVRRAQF